ncbi:MAG: YcaO-like family protein [Nanobdellota archaeon]
MDNTLSRMRSMLEQNKIISSLQKSFQFTDEPKFFQYTAFMNVNGLPDFIKDDDNQGSGLSLTDNKAQIKAMGECIERFELSSNFEIGIKKNFNQLDNAIDPVRFVNNQKITYSLKQELHDEEFNWISVFDILNNKDIYLPSQLIYVPYSNKERVLRLPISNGAACASTKEEAIYKGICELIERDSFMLTYLEKRSPIKINIDSINDSDLNEIISRMKRYFLEPYFFDITTDIKIPTILCVLVDRSGVGPAISIGTKTDWDVLLATKGAILEAQHTRLWIRYQLIEGKSIKDEKNMSSIEDRGLFWSSSSMIKHLDFILYTPRKTSIENLKIKISKSDYLKNVLNLLSEKNFTVFTKNLTSKETRNAGFFVYKTIIPELHPLYLFEHFKYFFGPRIKKQKLNKIPHPFV